MIRNLRSVQVAAIAVVCAAVSMTAAGAWAQDDDPHAACAASGWVPLEILDRPVPIRPGVGNAHEVVTTGSKQAQAFYDQGLNYLHGYVWIEAARSFRQALKEDSTLAMAWLGLSRVYSGLEDTTGARTALARAQALGARASDRERRRIALRAKHLEAVRDLENAGKHAEYKKAIDDALAVDIDDAELWLVRGNAEEGTAAGRGQRGRAASTAFYQEVLRIAPGHTAAHHYLTHSYETIGQIPQALEHGEAYATGAPAIPHAHHMWGHDLRRVGRVDDAIAAFRKTYDLEKAYYAAERIDAGLDWHHVHNLDLLGTAYQHKGRMKQAESTLREARALPSPTQYVEFNQKALVVFLMGRERWKEALREAGTLQKGQWAPSRAVGHALAGQALLALKRGPEAARALEAAERELSGIPKIVEGIHISHGAVKPYVDHLRGEIALRSGKTEEGRATLKEVEKALRAAPGPDAWIQALFRLETIARMAREIGDWELAEFTATQMLEHDGAYGGSHLAMALVADHEQDAATERKELDAALRCWSDADPDLAELKRVRSQMTALRQ